MNDTDGWFEVETISPTTTVLTEGELFQAYLVTGTERSVLVDTGIGIGDLRALVEGLTDTPIDVFLTHWHWDHIGAAHQFERVVIHPRERTAEGEVALDGLTDEFVQRPVDFTEGWLADGKAFPDGFDPDTYTIPPATGVGTVEAGDTLDLGDRELELYDVPGHSPGQLAALDRERGVLYGGDVVGVFGDLIALFEYCDLDDYEAALSTVIDLRDAGAFDTLLTGHNAPMTGEDLDTLDAMYDAIVAVNAGEGDYEVVETPWGPGRRHEYGPFGVIVPN
jgi:glyoxylase-like metal-dependent hydrolase (beta-lactamase superfamily II)